MEDTRREARVKVAVYRLRLLLAGRAVLLRKHEGLHLVQLAIKAVAFHELFVVSLLHDLPPVKHEDPIHRPDRRKPMRNDERRAVFQEAMDAFADQVLGL